MEDGLALWENTYHPVVRTYNRRMPRRVEALSESPLCLKGTAQELANSSSGEVIIRKRKYAQVYLDLGQSDFNLRPCSACGFNYAPGDEVDEKSHNQFHKNFTTGIPFKPMKNEKIIHKPSKASRIVLVCPDDRPPLRNKMQEAIQMMEIELGEAWILHKSCSVYMFISSNRVAGCVVAEPIKQAFKIHPDPQTSQPISSKPSPLPSTLKFGEIVFNRATPKKRSPSNSTEPNGAIVCEDEPIPATCGIRAIWVTHSNRRKRIASQLLESVRKTFDSKVLKTNDIAFSPPTSTGKALAIHFTGTQSFLVYKPEKN